MTQHFKILLLFLISALFVSIFLIKSNRFFLLKYTQKVAVIYIATGNYNIFWDNFYKSAEQHFLPGVNKHYFLISNHTFNKLPKNVTHIYYPHKEWPSILIEKFSIIHSLKNKLSDYKYTYSFNANTWFIQPIKEEEIIPNANQKIIAALHPGFYKKSTDLPYEKDKNSYAFLEESSQSKYYQSGVIGGITTEFIKMAQSIEKWTNSDLEKNYIPIWHDESYFNKYISDNDPLILTPNYIWGSWPNRMAFDTYANQVKIIMLNKNAIATSGINYFKDYTFLNQNLCLPQKFFYISYKNGYTDFILFKDSSFLVKEKNKKGKYTEKNGIYKLTDKSNKEECFKEIKKTRFLYQINCQKTKKRHNYNESLHHQKKQ